MHTFIKSSGLPLSYEAIFKLNRDDANIRCNECGKQKLEKLQQGFQHCKT